MAEVARPTNSVANQSENPQGPTLPSRRSRGWTILGAWFFVAVMLMGAFAGALAPAAAQTPTSTAASQHVAPAVVTTAPTTHATSAANTFSGHPTSVAPTVSKSSAATPTIQVSKSSSPTVSVASAPATTSASSSVKSVASSAPTHAAHATTMSPAAVLSATLTASPATVDVNSPMTFNTVATGGTPPYSYLYSGLPPGCATANTASLACTPSSTVGSPFSVSVAVTDSLAATAIARTTLTVNALPSVALIANPSTIDLGQGTTFSAAVSGGTGPFSYAYTGLPPGCSTIDAATLACTPTTTTGSPFTVTVTIHDSDGNSATGNVALTVNPTLSATFVASPSALAVGQWTTYTVTITGGTAPYVVNYGGAFPCSNGLPANGPIVGSSVSFPCRVGGTGTFTGSAQVLDSAPASFTAWATVVANPALIVATNLPTSSAVNNVLTITSTPVNGGVGPYTYGYTGLPAGCVSANAPSITCTPTVVGSFQVNQTINDSSNPVQHAWTVNTLTIQLNVSLSSNTHLTDVGESISVSSTVVGATGTISYSWSYPSGVSGTNCYTGSNPGNVPSFLCTPVGSGTMVVMLTVTDSGTGLSGTSWAPLVVVVNLGVSLTLPSSASVDLTQTIMLAPNYFADGTAPFTYSWSNLPTGCSSAPTLVLNCTATASGTYSSVTLTVTDSALPFAQSTSATMVVTINADPTATTPVGTGTAADVSQPVSFSSSMMLGSGTVGNGGSDWSWRNLPATATCTGAYTATITCTFAPGSYPLRVEAQVTDSYGITSPWSAPLLGTLVVSPDPALGALTPSSPSRDVGQTVTFTVAVASAGSGGDVFLWSGLPAGCAPANAASIGPCTVTTASSYLVSVQVTDSNGVVATSGNLPFTVYNDPYLVGPFVGQNTITHGTSADVGQTFQIAPTNLGSFGSGLPLSFAFTAGVPAGCTGSVVNYYLSCTGLTAGTINATITETFTDGNGFTSALTAQFQFAIYADPAISAPSVWVNGISWTQLDYTVTYTQMATSLNVGSGGDSYSWNYNSCGSVSCTGETWYQTSFFTLSLSVTDSNGFTATTSVGIAPANDPSANIPTVSIANPDVGQTEVFTGGATGGTGAYSVIWFPGSLPNGCPIIPTTFVVTCVLSASAVGSWNPTYQVTDGQGMTSINGMGLTVNADPLAGGVLEYNQTNNGQPVTSVDVGEQLSFNSAASLGTGTYTYAWTGLPATATCTLITTSAPVCYWTAPNAGVVVSVSYTVTDSDGISATSATLSSTIVVYADVLTTAPTMTVNGVARQYADEGQTLTFSVGVTSPGSGVASYTWYSLPSGCSSVNAPTFTCVANSYTSNYGSSDVYVQVYDTNGLSYTTTQTPITIAFAPYINSFYLNSGTSDVGLGDSFYAAVYWDASDSLASPTMSFAGLPTSGCAAPTYRVYNPNTPSAYEWITEYCIWSTPGAYTYTVTLSGVDDAGWSAVNGFASTVTATETVFALPSISAPVASHASADVNQVGWFNATVTNPGAGSNWFRWYGLPNGCRPSNGNTIYSPTTQCTFSTAGTYLITIQIWDTNYGWTTSSALSFTVFADPQAVYNAVNGQGYEPDEYNYSYVTADLGQSVWLYAHVTNVGSGGDTWYWTNVPSICAPVTTLLFKCTPTAVGNINQVVYFWLTDSNGFQWAGYSALDLYTSPDPTVTAVTTTYTAGPSAGLVTTAPNVDVGQGVTFTATATSALYYNPGSPRLNWFEGFNWTGLPTGVATCANVQSINPSCTFKTPGVYALTLTAVAQDHNGASSAVYSMSITVTVNAAPLLSTPTVTIQTPDVGQTVTFTTTVLAAGSGHDNFSWSGLPTGCPTSGTTLTVTCVLTASSNWYVQAKIIDSNLVWTWSPTLFISVANDPVINSVSASVNSVDVGQTYQLYSNVYWGSGNFNYTWSGLPAGCTGTWNVQPSCVAMTPGVGSLSVTLSIRDAAGFVVTKTFAVPMTVFADPSVSVPTASVPSIDYGQTVVFSTTVLTQGSGGWYVNWVGSPCSGIGTGLTTGPCAAYAGTFQIYVQITDSNGFTASAGPLLYHVFNDPTVNAPYLQAGGTDVGETSILAVAATSGSLSYTYAWAGLPAGCAASVLATVSCQWTTPGTYFVTVVVTDSNGVASSPSQPLTLVINADPAITHLVANPTVTDATEGISINATATGGTGVYSQFHWYGYPLNQCSFYQYATGDLMQCYNAVAGTYQISVVVVDNAGVISAPSSAITLVVNPQLTVATPTTSPAVADVGQTDTITAVPGGGTGTYTWAWSGLPATGCTGLTSQVVTCVLAQPGNFLPYVTITDQAGFTAISGEAYLTVELPLTTAITTNTSADVVNTPQWFEDNIHGGDAPYTVTWSFGDGSGASQAGYYLNWSVQHVYRAAGTYKVQIWVNDSAGQTAVSTYSVKMGNALAPLLVSVSLNANDVASGTSVTAAAAVTGGTGTYTYVWWVGGVQMGTGSTLTFKPGLSGVNYTVKVTVTDSSGASASASTVLTTTPATSSATTAQTTQALLFGYSAIALTIGLLVVFALLLIYLFTRRRREHGASKGPISSESAAPTQKAPSSKKDSSEYSEDDMVAQNSDEKTAETSTKSS